ncbi:MAG: hypothetical protein E7426_08530 [Ruminococcaceae bacterium]|jgi:hypothetical protein|nr:hypothetical protein [Oscillospiraceae bacterium]
MDQPILVRFLHPETDAVLEVSLAAQTRFAALTAVLCGRGFVPPQKPGYAFLCGGHLCSPSHILADYLPGGAAALELQVFAMPQIMV